MMSFLHQFIPIGLLFLFLSYRNEFVDFSQTPWGKIFAVCMILLYTHMDKVFGLFVCSLVILYYQSEWVENFLNMKNIEEWEDELMKKKQPEENKVDYLDIDHVQSSVVQNEFREKHCKNGTLKYKNMDVKTDMTSHVFPEVKFNADKCNVCSPNCNFSIIESKFKAENKVKSKCSTNM